MRPIPRDSPPALRIEPETGWAWLGEQRLELPPKLFAVLRHLVEHPERLITKDELLTVGWGDAVVSEASLTSCIRDLRKALDDSSRAPRYIETVHRRGFRFIGPVGTGPIPRVRPMPPLLSSMTTLVGRDADLARLHAFYASASAGERRLLFVTGEAGIGKTTLVDTFLAAIEAIDGVRVGRGHCVESYGATEPYLPLLDALGRMGRGPHGEELVRILQRYAPTWLAQLPALLDDQQLESLQRRVQATTRERMLRELVEAIEALSAATPLVLVLEDLHWSDAATVDLLAMLARRPDPAQLLIVGTYRSAEVAAGQHPLKPVKEGLQIHADCEELALDFLTVPAVSEYLDRRFPGAAFPATFAAALRDNTGGNPLFLVNVVDDLIARDQLHERDGRWTLAIPVERLSAEVPRTLAQMIETQIDRLTPEEQAMLAVASVAGAEFSAALATADDIDVRAGERCCAELARRGQFVRALGLAEWPDGTVAGRYGFIHAMYRNVPYARVPIGHRVGLHLRIGERLERAYGARAHEIAGELAMHFEHGRDVERAVHYRRQAADTTLRQHAHREAVDHARRALALLATLPESPERNQRELAIQTVLGAASIAMSGWAAPEVADAYARARVLCEAVGVTPQLFPVLLGVAGFALMRGDLRLARESSQQLLGLAETTDDDAVRLAAHNCAGMTAFYGGEFAAALAHFEQARAIYDPERHSPNRLRAFSVDHDPGISCTAHTGMTLMMLGHQDQAAASMRECLAYADAIDHPLSVAMGYNFAAVLHQYRREAKVVRELEDFRLAYAQRHDFDLFLMLGEIYRGWLLAEEGRVEEGAAMISNGLMVYQAVGAELGRPTFLGILADVSGRVGRFEEGLARIAEALDLADRTGLHYWDAELQRLKGSLVLRGASTRARAASEREAEACFRAALEIARRQGSRAAELRAVMDLARLWTGQDKRAEARTLLANIYGWFSEGFATPDLIEARALLEELGS